jgi:hypothetical protein
MQRFYRSGESRPIVTPTPAARRVSCAQAGLKKVKLFQRFPSAASLSWAQIRAKTPGLKAEARLFIKRDLIDNGSAARRHRMRKGTDQDHRAAALVPSMNTGKSPQRRFPSRTSRHGVPYRERPGYVSRTGHADPIEPHRGKGEGSGASTVSAIVGPQGFHCPRQPPRANLVATEAQIGQNRRT